MRASLAPPFFDRDQQYEHSARTVRWVCLGLVLLTYPPNQAFSIAVFTLILVAAIYNGLRYNRRLGRTSIMQSQLNSLVADYIFVLTLVVLSGGLASPYYPFFFLLIIGVVANFGIAGFAMSLAGQVVITPALLAISNDALPATREYQFIVKIVFLIVFSLVALQSVHSRNEEDLVERRFTGRIQNERQRLLSLINSLSSAVIAVDEHGKVYLYNAAALDLLNTNRDITGQKVNELLPLHDRKLVGVDLLELMKSRDHMVHRQDLIFVPNDESEMILDLTITPVHLSGAGDERRGGYMLVFSDITKQKSLDEERDEFISVTSHELRTPLAIAEANLSTALLPGYAKIEPKAASLLNQAHENVIFLSELIKDLTTLSRAERGVLKSDLAIIDLKELTTELQRDYEAQAKAKGLLLKLEQDPGVGKVYSSPPEIREILQNFITNALKYTTRGSITITLEHHRAAAVVRVSDTGIGISASDKAKMFTKFFRSEDFRTRATGGTGLGLYITKKVAEHLGLAIDFTSRLNHGSTFTLTIPYQISATKPDETAKPS